MKALNQLPEIADRQLGGLEADTRLLARIRINAAEGKHQSYHTAPRWQVATAICCALVLCVGGVLWATDTGNSPMLINTQHSLLDSHAAGTAKVTEAPPALSDLPGNSITMSGAGKRSGDTLFAGSMGRCDFPGSSIFEMRKSLRRLCALSMDYRVFPGHGESSTLSRERQTNPYLRDFL